MKCKGRITRIISNLYTVEVGNQSFDCRARGKFRNDDITPLVGDYVIIDNKENYILEILERTNKLDRPPIANVSVGLIITSVKKPDLSLSLLDKQIICLSKENIEPVIVLTKLDLLDSKGKKDILKLFKYYKSLGYKVFTNKNLYKIKHALKGKVALVTGQTGAGKSTLLNKLDKGLSLKTSPISEALGRGIHTTRHTELYKIKNFYIADTPGFSALDLNFDKDLIKDYYPEFKLTPCKYQDCKHVKEDGCTVKKKVEEGLILKSRYENYLKFRGE